MQLEYFWFLELKLICDFLPRFTYSGVPPGYDYAQCNHTLERLANLARTQRRRFYMHGMIHMLLNTTHVAKPRWRCLPFE